MISLVQGFAGLTVAFAGIAIGMCFEIVRRYWSIWRRTRNGARLLPSHILLIGTSYSMIAVVAVARLGNPPIFRQMAFGEWWIYPFVTLAFLLGDIALVLIFMFISKRGTRVA